MAALQTPSRRDLSVEQEGNEVLVQKHEWGSFGSLISVCEMGYRINNLFF